MAIESININKIVAFDHIKFDFHYNVSILIGPNGTGKTMALKAICAKLKGNKPGEHDLVPEKLDIKFTKDHKPGLVWMMEEHVSEKWLDFELQNLFKVDQKTREEALEIAGKFNKWKAKDYKEIRFFGDTRDLSFGEKKILVIATWLARAVDGDVIILDQPENGLHIESQEALIDLIEREKQGVQAIIATHSPYILNGHCEELAEVMK